MERQERHFAYAYAALVGFTGWRRAARTCEALAMKKPDHTWTVAGRRDLGEDYGSVQSKRELFDTMGAQQKDWAREMHRVFQIEFADAWKHLPGAGRDRPNN